MYSLYPTWGEGRSKRGEEEERRKRSSLAP